MSEAEYLLVRKELEPTGAVFKEVRTEQRLQRSYDAFLVQVAEDLRLHKGYVASNRGKLKQERS